MRSIRMIVASLGAAAVLAAKASLSPVEPTGVGHPSDRISPSERRDAKRRRKEEGMDDVPESRQVRRAREREEAKDPQRHKRQLKRGPYGS